MSLGQGMVALSAGPLSSWIIHRTGLETILIRKGFQTFAMIGPAICLTIIPIVGCHSTVVIVCLILSLCSYGMFTGGEWPIISEFAPNSSGVIFGIANAFAVAAGILGPYIVGVILGEDKTQHLTKWNIVFYTTAAVFVFGAVTFILFGTSDQQPWDKALNEDDDEVEAETEDAKERSKPDPETHNPGHVITISNPDTP